MTTELNAEIAQRGLGDSLNQNSITALNGQLGLLRSTLNTGTTGDDLSDIGTPASDDKVLIQDTSDSNNLKYVDFGDFSSAGSLSNISEDTSPQLGANLDVQSRSLFTSTSNGDIQFTPNGTGSVNLDGTVKFKRFASGSAPDPFEGGMYADDNDELYFGVS